MAPGGSVWKSEIEIISICPGLCSLPPAYALGVVLFLLPALALSNNYHRNDRSGNWIPWDYAYNLLNSCEKDAIMFTNGDNDTFPLWFLQEVERVRQDVRIVNLRLLNTNWYIKQLRDREPQV